MYLFTKLIFTLLKQFNIASGPVDFLTSRLSIAFFLSSQPTLELVSLVLCLQSLPHPWLQIESIYSSVLPVPLCHYMSLLSIVRLLLYLQFSVSCECICKTVYVLLWICHLCLFLNSFFLSGLSHFFLAVLKSSCRSLLLHPFPPLVPCWLLFTGITKFFVKPTISWCIYSRYPGITFLWSSDVNSHRFFPFLFHITHLMIIIWIFIFKILSQFSKSSFTVFKSTLLMLLIPLFCSPVSDS